LIRAYGSSTALVLEKADIIPYRLYHNVKIMYDYPDTNHIMHIIEKYNLKILENSYDERATIIVMVDEDTISSFTDEIETPTKPGIKTVILS
jgi:putative IMPACT (imprinted ancient) family translation regulator